MDPPPLLLFIVLTVSLLLTWSSAGLPSLWLWFVEEKHSSYDQHRRNNEEPDELCCNSFFFFVAELACEAFSAITLTVLALASILTDAATGIT